MAKYASCYTCQVCRDVKCLLDEYDEHRVRMSQADIERISDHARGHIQGQISVMSEILQQLADLLPLMDIERMLRLEGKGN